MAYDAAGRLIAHDSRGLRIWQDGSALSQSPSLVPIPINAHGPGGSQIRLARSADGQTMVLVRSSEISLWQATHPDRVRPVVAPPQAPGEELPPFPGPPPPPPTGATATIAPGSRFEGRGRPGNPNRNGAFRGDPIAVQLAPRGDRIYMLGDFNRLIIWALDPGDASGPIKAHRLESAEGLPDGLTRLALRPDGSLLAIGDRTGTVTLLDTARLSVLGRINPLARMPRACCSPWHSHPTDGIWRFTRHKGRSSSGRLPIPPTRKSPCGFPASAGCSQTSFSTLVASAWPAAAPESNR